MAPTEANWCFYAKGKGLWDEYQDISDTEAKAAFLDRLIEDDRLAMTYAGGFFGRNELVDLEDDGDDDEVRFRLAEGIRRGREHARSTIAQWEKTGELDTSQDSETESRERRWYTSWLVLGGSDINRRSSLPSIPTARSSGTKASSASSTNSSKTISSNTMVSPSPPMTPRTIQSYESPTRGQETTSVRPKTTNESRSPSFDFGSASTSSASLFSQPQSTMTRPSIDTGSSRIVTTIDVQKPPSLRSLARWTCCAT